MNELLAAGTPMAVLCMIGTALWVASQRPPRCRVCFTRIGDPGDRQTINGQSQVCSVACATMQDFLDEGERQ